MLLGIIQSNSGFPFTLLHHLAFANAHLFREVLGDVQNIIEDAAQKDSFIAKTHKRLSTRLGLNVRSEYIFFILMPVTRTFRDQVLLPRAL